MKKVIGLVIGLVPVSAFGECVPVPDCTTIGYTETSCEGDSLKCPFDSTKLKCFPCDSSFRYSCDGENITNPIGNACNNKYAACNCIAGATFTNGECICNTSCETIGNIYYSDGTCNSCVDTTKTAVAIIIHSNNQKRILAPLNSFNVKWATDNKDVPAMENFADAETAKTDMDGVGNTLKIIEYFSTDDSSNNAAWYCYNFEPDWLKGTKNQWYFPSAGELYAYLNQNYAILNDTYQRLGITLGGWYISSTEKNYANMWGVSPGRENVSLGTKFYAYTITCFLSMPK